MPLPTILPSGIVAIYGTGTATSPSGLTNLEPSGDMRWGYIYQVYDGGAVYVYDGDSVMFKERDVYNRIRYNDYPYTLVPLNLVTKEPPLL